MGNWRNRPRFYRRSFHSSPPRSCYSDGHSSPSGFGKDDGVPAWEKKFCELIGSVPWQKVVEFNNFKSWYEGTVTSWDASACEEAFHNAKNRFWSEMNGLPCDISPPDPNMYIDEINWDTVTDPELINDLEREYFVDPDGELADFKLGHQNKKMRDSETVPLKGCDEGTRVLNNPWEGSDIVCGVDMLKNDSQGWNPWESYSNKRFRDSNNCENPLEVELSHRHEAAKDATWGAYTGKRWKDNGWENGGWRNSGWRNIDRSNNGWKNGGMGNRGWDKLAHQNKKMRNFKTFPHGNCNEEFDRFMNLLESSHEVHLSNRLRNKSQGWNLWESKTKKEFKDSNHCRNRREANPVHVNETARDSTLRDYSGERWEDKEWEKQQCGRKRWDKYVDNSPGPKWQHLSQKSGSYNPWRHGFVPDDGPLRNEAWGDFGAYAVVGQTQEANNTKHRRWEAEQLSKSSEDPNAVSLKRDGNHGYRSDYRNSRFKRDDNRASSDWRNPKVNRSVAYAVK